VGSREFGAAGAGGLGGGAAVSGPPGGRELDRACPAVGDVARLRAVAAEQRLPAANAAYVVWGDRLAAADRTVSEGLQGLAGCAIVSGVGLVAAPTLGGGSAVDALPLVIGADGVMVPVRPHPRTAKGKSRWREIKVAILARLGARLTREATRVTRLWQRVGYSGSHSITI